MTGYGVTPARDWPALAALTAREWLLDLRADWRVYHTSRRFPVSLMTFWAVLVVAFYSMWGAP